MLVLNLPAFEVKNTQPMTVSMEMVPIWQNPDQERTNHNAQIYLAIYECNLSTPVPHIVQ